MKLLCIVFFEVSCDFVAFDNFMLIIIVGGLTLGTKIMPMASMQERRMATATKAKVASW
jgi:hypothetical protein